MDIMDLLAGTSISDSPEEKERRHADHIHNIVDQLVHFVVESMYTYGTQEGELYVYARGVKAAAEEYITDLRSVAEGDTKHTLEDILERARNDLHTARRAACELDDYHTNGKMVVYRAIEVALPKVIKVYSAVSGEDAG